MCATTRPLAWAIELGRFAADDVVLASLPLFSETASTVRPLRVGPCKPLTASPFGAIETAPRGKNLGRNFTRRLAAVLAPHTECAGYNSG